MGGNLIKNYGIESKRLNLEEYSIIKDDVLFHIDSSLHPSCKYFVPPHIRNKETFGDLDVVVYIPGNIKHLFEKLLGQKINFQFTHTNGNCFSFGYKNFQIDLIYPKYKYLENNLENKFHVEYLSWGDGGNLIGMFANRNGMKLTQDGLYYEVKYYETQLLESILLTDDWDQMLNFFDLNITKWNEGFNTQEELYEFLVRSKYFNIEWFNPKLFNHEKRDREKHRPTFANFMIYLEERKDTFTNIKIDWIYNIENYFNISLRDKIKELKEEASKRQVIKKIMSTVIEERGWTNEEKSIKIPAFKLTNDYKNLLLINPDDWEIIIRKYLI